MTHRKKIRFSIFHLLLFTLLVGMFLAFKTNPKSKWEKMSVRQAYDHLEKTIKKYDPKFDWNASPASPETIARLRKELPDAPRQFFELLEICDYTACGLFSPIDLTPLHKLKDGTQVQMDFFYGNGFQHEGWVPDKYGICKSEKHWRKGWIPLGDFNGDPIFIDMDPSETGIPGQIVSIQTDGWYLDPQAYSIAHWLYRIAEKVEKDKEFDGFAFVYHPMPPLE